MNDVESSVVVVVVIEKQSNPVSERERVSGVVYGSIVDGCACFTLPL